MPLETPWKNRFFHFIALKCHFQQKFHLKINDHNTKSLHVKFGWFLIYIIKVIEPSKLQRIYNKKQFLKIKLYISQSKSNVEAWNFTWTFFMVIFFEWSKVNTNKVFLFSSYLHFSTFELGVNLKGIGLFLDLTPRDNWKLIFFLFISVWFKT